MKLRQKSKRDQALDAVASVAKTWSEWHLGERISKTATKGAKKAAKKASKKAKKASLPTAATRKSAGTKRKPLRIAGILAVLGGIGAAVASKLKRGGGEPVYTPPGPATNMEAPPPTPVVVEDLAKEPLPEPVPVEPTDIALADLAAGAGTAAPGAPSAPSVNEPLSDAPAATTPAEDLPPSADLAPEPEDLVSDTAKDEADADAADRTSDKSS